MLYLYDSHCWTQAQESSNEPYRFYFPEGYEEVGKAWAHYAIKKYTPTVASFLEFVSPQRLMGISFLDYAYMMGYTNTQKTLEIMCQPEFIYSSYEKNLKINLLRKL